jgi:integrase
MAARRRGQIIELRSGRFAIRYHGPDGRRYWERFGTDPKAAERALTARLRDIDQGAWREPCDVTLGEYAERWLERKRTRLAHSTWVTYSMYLRRHVLPTLGKRRLATLRPADFDELAHDLEAGGMQPGTVRNVIVPVRSLLSDAVRRGDLTFNPASRVDVPPPPESRGVVIPPDHCAAIRAALEALAAPDPFRPDEPDMLGALLFDVALGTGARLGELAALRFGDLDFEGRVVRIERAIVRGREKRPKSGKARHVPMFPSVHTALRALAARALDRGRYAPSEALFSSMTGTPIDSSNVNHRIWRPALGHAKLLGHGYRFHDLRHTCLSRLVASGADVAIVQAVAGHSAAATTLRLYVHLAEERRREAALLFDPGQAPATDVKGSRRS